MYLQVSQKICNIHLHTASSMSKAASTQVFHSELTKLCTNLPAGMSSNGFHSKVSNYTLKGRSCYTMERNTSKLRLTIKSSQSIVKWKSNCHHAQLQNPTAASTMLPPRNQGTQDNLFCCLCGTHRQTKKDASGRSSMCDYKGRGQKEVHCAPSRTSTRLRL